MTAWQRPSLLEKGSDGSLLREIVAFMAKRLMAADIDACVGAAYGARSQARENWRSGYHERGRRARAGTVRVADFEAAPRWLLSEPFSSQAVHPRRP